jgi:uncharacterized membrane protein YhdT
MGLFVIVLVLWVIMPALIYLLGWGVTRYTAKAPSGTGFPVPRKNPSNKPVVEE